MTYNNKCWPWPVMSGISSTTDKHCPAIKWWTKLNIPYALSEITTLIRAHNAFAYCGLRRLCCFLTVIYFFLPILVTIIIIININVIYRAQTSQVQQMRQVSCCMITVIIEQEHFQSFPEHWQWNVQQTEFGWKTVPHDWSGLPGSLGQLSLPSLRGR